MLFMIAGSAAMFASCGSQTTEEAPVVEETTEVEAAIETEAIEVENTSADTTVVDTTSVQ